MNSLRNISTRSMQANANRYFWSEMLALPIAIAAMEGIAVGITIAVISLWLHTSTLPVTIGECFLLDIALLWWAQFTSRLANRRSAWNAMNILGLLVVMAIVELPSYAVFSPSFEFFFTIALRAGIVIYFWQQGIHRSEQTVAYEEMRDIFRFSFAAVFGSVVLAAIIHINTPMIAQIEIFVFLYIIGSICALALTRLSVIRDTRVSASGDPTRIWIIFLVLLGLTVIIGGIILESLISIDHLIAILQQLQPIFRGIGTIIIWLLAGLGWLLSPFFYVVEIVIDLFIFFISLFQSKPKKLKIPPFTGKQPSIPSPSNTTTATFGIVAVIILIVLAVAFILRTLRRFNVHTLDAGVVEIRENLGFGSLFDKRRRRQTHAMHHIEHLNPQSARAQYREILTMANTTRILPRNASETPQEYERRVHEYVVNTAVSDQTVLTEDLATITQLYRKERYGNAETGQKDRQILGILVPRLIRQLFGDRHRTSKT